MSTKEAKHDPAITCTWVECMACYEKLAVQLKSEDKSKAKRQNILPVHKGTRRMEM